MYIAEAGTLLHPFGARTRARSIVVPLLVSRSQTKYSVVFFEGGRTTTPLCHCAVRMVTIGLNEGPLIIPLEGISEFPDFGRLVSGS